MISKNIVKPSRLVRLILIGSALIMAILIGWGSASSVTAVPTLNLARMGSGLDLTAQFSPDTIAPDGVTTLIFTLNNIDGIPHSGVTLTNTLPAGVTLAMPANPTTNCNGSLSAPDGDSQILFDSGRLGIDESCTIQVNVTSSTLGPHTNISDNLSSVHGSYVSATDDLEVIADRPSFSMAFSPNRIFPNSVSRLTYTIDNSAVNELRTNGSFSHALPAGLVIADPPNFSLPITCGSSSTVEAGSSSFSFYSGAIQANTTCTIAFDVLAELPGLYNTTTSNLTSAKFGFPPSDSSGAAEDVLDARTQPFVKAFLNDPVGAGDTVTLAYTISNYDRESPLSNIAFTDNLNSALAGLAASGLPLNNVCGNGSTLSGATMLTLSGGNLPAESSCTFEVTLTVPNGATMGDHLSTSSSLSGQQNSAPFTADAASDTLVITPLPKISKQFLTSSAQSGETVTVEFTITNTSGTESASSITFADNLTEFIPSTTPGPLPSDSCGVGSSLIYTSLGTDIWGIQLSNGTLPAANSCTFTVTLQLPDQIPQGNYINTAGTLSAVISSETYAGKSASDSLTIIAPPTFQAEFVNDPVLPGNTTDLVYTINHAGSDDALPVNAATNITFTHDLDSVISGLAATGLPILDSCGTGSTLSGTSMVSLTGGNLQPGEICTITLTVQLPAGAPVGTFSLPTSNLAAVIDGQPISGSSSNPELDITTLSFSKRFLPDTALAGQEITLEYTVTNQSSTRSTTGIFFTDSLSSVISGLSSNSGGQSDICGAGSSLSSTTLIIFADGNLGPSESCTFSVTVVIPGGAANGDYTSVTSGLSATVDGSAAVIDPAGTSLTIDSSRLSLEKEFSGESNLPGVTSSLIYTVTNLDDDNAINAITFTDDLDGVVSGLQAGGLPASDICGAGSSLTGSSIITLANASIPAGSSCTFTLSVSVPLAAESGNYLSTSSDLSGQLNSLLVDGPAASGNLEISQLNFSHEFDSAGAPNTIVPLTFMISNPIEVSTFEDIAFINNLNDMLPGLAAVNLPLTDVCGPGSMLTGDETLTLSGGTLREFGFCTFTVDVKLPKNVPLDSYLNTINGLSKSGILVSLPYSTTLNIIRPEVSQTSIVNPVTDVLPGQPVSYRLSATNSGVGTATEIKFTNVAPAEIEINGIVTSTQAFTQTTASEQVSFETDQIAPNKSATIELSGVISPALNSDQTISHTVILTATADVSPTNNSQSLAFNLTVPRVQLDANSQAVTVSEEDGVATLTVTLDAANPYAPVELIYQTTAGTAEANNDFIPTTSGTVIIPAGSTSGTISIPLINDDVAEDSETFAINLTSSWGGQIGSSSTASITITDSDANDQPPVTPTPPAPGETSGQIYLPLVLNIEQKSAIQAPDLVVDSIQVEGSAVTVVIRNAGNTAVVNPFWVDLIIDPTTPPTQVNDTAEVLNAVGLVWGIQGGAIPLAADETLTLTVDGPYFYSALSTLNGSIPAGADLYAHVDSASTTTTHGAVQEGHEISGSAYNNILQVTSSADLKVSVETDVQGRSRQGSQFMPGRP
ncbi:MAG: Calx-beta domain-containing protein [Anaerolineae bacterium]